jgi:thiamine biosynthesis protein ThiS
VKIVVYGEKVGKTGLTIREYLEALRFDVRIVAVELNQKDLHKADFSTTRINNGDRISIASVKSSMKERDVEMENARM